MHSIIKWILIISLSMAMMSQAQSCPYFRISGGQSNSSPGQTQTINFSPTYWKTDIADKDLVIPLFVGLSAGQRLQLANNFEAEIGVGYYQIHSFTLNGKVYQYSTPEFYNMNYHYTILHRSFMFEGKLMRCYRTIYHPYLSAGIGLSHNYSYAYREIPFTEDAVPDPAFASQTQTSLSYALGLGIDVDVALHWRLGVGYQYKNLGAAQLGKSTEQQSSEHIHINSISANQYLIALTYTM